jgi:hypothetical protein
MSTPYGGRPALDIAGRPEPYQAGRGPLHRARAEAVEDWVMHVREVAGGSLHSIRILAPLLRVWADRSSAKLLAHENAVVAGLGAASHLFVTD